MRTFIAIDLSEKAKNELTKLQAELKKSNADVKWVDPKNIHVTLKFLGEISDQQVNQVKETLDKIAPQFKPYEISLSGIGAFPKLDYPRVVWVGIENGKDQTKEIAVRIDVELEKLGFKKEDRAFSAHLTIGRVRGLKNKQVLKEKIQSINYKPSTINHQVVSSINLYQSTLTPQGPIYTSLHKAGL